MDCRHWSRCVRLFLVSPIFTCVIATSSVAAPAKVGFSKSYDRPSPARGFAKRPRPDRTGGITARRSGRKHPGALRRHRAD